MDTVVRVTLPLVAEAEREGVALGHSYIGVEHLLIAVAAAAEPPGPLQVRAITASRVRAVVAEVYGREAVAPAVGAPLQWTHRAQVAVGLALARAREASAAGLGEAAAYSSADLLAALVAERVVAHAALATVFRRLEVDVAQMRREVGTAT